MPEIITIMMTRGGVLLLILTAGLFLTDASLLHRRELTQEDGPHAVCNDGTPAVYYHSESWEGRDPGRIVIYIDGGFFCYDPSECIRRCHIDFPYLCTARQDKAMEGEGILSDDVTVNRHLASAYKVHVDYCTSDMFIGDRAGDEDTAGFHFRGRRVFNAAINSLKRHSKLGHATEVILAGCSAGGRGVAFNCHHLQSLLPEAKVKCIVDAAILYPVRTPFIDTCRDFNTVVHAANDYWHGTLGKFDIDTWWKEFDLPLFIGIQIFDEYGLYYYCGNSRNPDHLKEWGEGMVETVLAVSRERPDIGLFLPATFEHPMIYIDEWYSKVFAGHAQISYGEAIGNWLSDKPPYQVWDQCTHSPQFGQNCTRNVHNEL